MYECPDHVFVTLNGGKQFKTYDIALSKKKVSLDTHPPPHIHAHNHKAVYLVYECPDHVFVTLNGCKQLKTYDITLSKKKVSLAIQTTPSPHTYAHNHKAVYLVYGCPGHVFVTLNRGKQLKTYDIALSTKRVSLMIIGKKSLFYQRTAFDKNIKKKKTPKNDREFACCF